MLHIRIYTVSICGHAVSSSTIMDGVCFVWVVAHAIRQTSVAAKASGQRLPSSKLNRILGVAVLRPAFRYEGLQRRGAPATNYIVWSGPRVSRTRHPTSFSGPCLAAEAPNPCSLAPPCLAIMAVSVSVAPLQIYFPHGWLS